MDAGSVACLSQLSKPIAKIFHRQNHSILSVILIQIKQNKKKTFYLFFDHQIIIIFFLNYNNKPNN